MGNILEYLEQSEKRFGDKAAVDDGSRSYTYHELLILAKKIGSGLSCYTEPGCPVPVMVDKGADTLAAMLGAVYAGCFYVTIHPGQPVERLKDMLCTLQAPVIVTVSEHVSKIRDAGFTGRICLLGELAESPSDEGRLQEIRNRTIDSDLLYGMFTSGSTGVPKNVIVSHRAALDFIGSFTELFDITDQDVIGNQAPFDFDVSVKDIYSALKTGATLVIIPTALFSTPPLLLDFLCEKKVTVLIWAVSALCLISALRGLEYKAPETVDKILFSGEAMPVRQLNIWRKYLPDAAFVNLYGPTEITCNCTYYRIEKEFGEDEKLPAGRPFPNRRVFLLDDKDRRIVKPGQQGEVCVAGTSLAEGYYNNPEQTGKSFVQNPFRKGYQERIYRTGDLAYYDEEGLLYFCGRKDFQIKHMGHRIELEEIEAVINSVAGVQRGYCVFDHEKNRIVAFVAGSAGKPEIRARLKEKLPPYMVPGVFVPIPEVVLTKNGKVDRQYYMKEYKEGRR